MKVLSANAGDTIMYFAELKEPRNFTSEFDYKAWLRHHRVVATAYATKWKVNKQKNTWGKHYFVNMRQHLLSVISDQPFSKRERSVFVALTLGEKSQLEPELKQRYSNAGASHILALSGLHLSIVYGVLMFLLGADVRRPRWNAFVQIPILLFVWGYVFLTSCPLSLVRAAVMATFFSVGIILGQKGNSINTLSLAAFVMLLYNPLSLFDVGAQMSFSAVYSILIFFKPLYKCLKFRNRAVRYIWGIVCVSIVAQIGVAPLVALYFGKISLLFILTNLIVVPLVTMIVCLSFFYFAFWGFAYVTSFLSIPLSFLLEKLNDSVLEISSISFSTVDNLNISVFDVFGYYTAILLLWYSMRKHGGKRTIMIQCAVVSFLACHLVGCL